MNTTFLHWVGDQIRNLCLQVPMGAVRAPSSPSRFC